jgi:hypothetical protein
MYRGHFKHAETHLTRRARHMVLNRFVGYLSMAVLRPMRLTHDAVFDLEAIDRNGFQTRAMHVDSLPFSDQSCALNITPVN